MVNRRPRELYTAGLAIIVITLFYLSMNVILGDVPAASSFYGHSMGVVGFLLMLMTETLYSLRKRSRLARWGKMSSWLQFHIFTGIVGPYLVLLHSSWKFNGVAGVLTLMTGIIVISGFIGRYIYTSVPRTADGLELETDELQRQIAAVEGHVQAWTSTHEVLIPALASQEGPDAAGDGVVMHAPGEGLPDRQGGIRGWHPEGNPEAGLHEETGDLKELLHRRDALHRQAASLQAARKLLATWHTIHIPIGLGLFALAFVHIVAAIYYAELLR